MAGYRRFIAYVYEYRKGKKESNCGFVKVEVREQRCSMEVHLHCPGLTPLVECKVYGFVRKDGLINGVLLGSCETGEDIAECLIETDSLNMGDSGISLGKMGGMVIVTEAGGFFGTEWDDQPIRQENFRELRIESRPVMENASPKEMPQTDMVTEISASGGGAANNTVNNIAKETAKDTTNETVIETTVKATIETVNNITKDTVDDTAKETENETVKETAMETADETEKEIENETEKFTENGTAKEIAAEAADDTEKEIENETAKYTVNAAVDDIVKDAVNAQEYEAEAAERPEPAKEGAVIENFRKELQDNTGHETIKPREENISDVYAENTEEPNRTEEEAEDNLGETAGRPRPCQPIPIPMGEKFSPFDDSDMAECRKIHPQDFAGFPRREAALRNNRFLQYGYYSFGHLLLCRREDGQYLLGVPGGYDQQERFMANMFGFPYFKESPLIKLPRGKGGYWYRLINPPDFN